MTPRQARREAAIEKRIAEMILIDWESDMLRVEQDIERVLESPAGPQFRDLLRQLRELVKPRLEFRPMTPEEQQTAQPMLDRIRAGRTRRKA